MRKNSLKISLLLASVILGILGGVIYNGYNSNSDRVYAQAIMKYDGFDDLLESADLIVTGTVENIAEHTLCDEYIISVTDTKKGESLEQILVRNYLYEYTCVDDEEQFTGKTNTDYEVGETYVFILQHVKNVYEEFYMIVSDSHIPMDEMSNSTVLSMRPVGIDNCAEYIDAYQFKSKKGKGHELSIDYINSEKMEDIVSDSKYVVVIEPQELYRTTEVVDVYSCSVKEVMKGDLTTDEKGEIIIPFFKSSVEKGKTYIVSLNSDAEDAIIYTLSSKNSVMEKSDMKEIKKMLEE